MEAVAEVRKGSVTCPVMIDGRSRRSRAKAAAAAAEVAAAAVAVVAGTAVRILAVVAEAAAEVVGATTDATRTTGPFLCPGMSVSRLSSLAPAILESTSANMKIFLLKQPVIKSREILHL